METTTDQNKALVRRFFAAVQAGELHLFDELIAEDYADHLAGQKAGRENLKKYFAGLREAFPDIELPISAVVAEGNLVAVLNRVRGTHQGDYGAFKAKGNRVDAPAFQLYRVANGQLAEHWEVADFMTLIDQIQREG